jgi:predicted ATPase/class 3 adenylate cyclase
MSVLPAGTVTFLLTDIEGSTRLWEQHRDAMQAALARHDILLSTVIALHGGQVVKSRGEGDSLFAVFPRATDAVAAALTAQRALLNESWSLPEPPRVRMAIHTGEAELRDGDYYGAAVNRCARLRSIGHGGQVLVTAATQELVRDQLPAEARLRELGAHRLRDLARPEQVYQLEAPDLSTDFPPLRSLDARPHNLPVQPTALLGRETEIADLTRMLHGDARLVTLTGPGGMGKTRLALQVAAELLDEFTDGVFFVALAPISDPALVLPTIAKALGVQETAGQSLADRVQGYLHDKQVLLLLDNFEQVTDAAPAIAELLAACPRLRVLVTSRAVLHVYGAQEFPVPPLALPPVGNRQQAPGNREAPERVSPPSTQHPPPITQYAAVALFIQRAQAVKPDFAVTNANAPAVAEICYRLDGLPLAIELAAARIRILSPQALLARLEHRLTLLTGGARDLPARQQTLRDAIAWSYDLLSLAEQILFRRLAVFVGGCTLEAAEAVCADLSPDPSPTRGGQPNSTAVEQAPLFPRMEGGPGGSGLDMLEGVASLVEKSLLRHEEPAGEPRYVMLETIREFGLERLAQAEELAALRRRHAAYCVTLAEQGEPKLYGPEQIAWLDRLETEHDNLRAAMAWGLTADAETGGETALRLSGALAWFWYMRSHSVEGLRWLTRALAAAPGRSAARMKALHGTAWLAHMQHDAVTMRARCEESLAIARELDDRWTVAWVLHLLGRDAYFAGDPATARALGQESLAVAEAVGDRWLIAQVLHLLGLAAHIAAEYATARAYYEQSLALRRALGDLEGIARSTHFLGLVAYRESDFAAARALYRNALTVHRELNHPQGLLILLGEFTALAAALQQPARAARLAGASAMVSASSQVVAIPLAEAVLQEGVEQARRALGEAAFAAAWAEGRALSLEEAIEEALRVGTD